MSNLQFTFQTFWDPSVLQFMSLVSLDICISNEKVKQVNFFVTSIEVLHQHVFGFFGPPTDLRQHK